jgi:hypothetical protein
VIASDMLGVEERRFKRRKGWEKRREREGSEDI